MLSTHAEYIMKMNTETKKPTSVEEYKLETNFEKLRQELLQDEYSDRIDNQLAYWALPSDRRLPLALMGYSLRELLAMPFSELMATAGIGQKKIASLITLLNRATQQAPMDPPEDPILDSQPAEATSGDGFDAESVSELVWQRWRATVIEHAVGHTLLGRLAPTLQTLPTVIWNTPLNYYVDRSAADIRKLKRHGEKRVRVVLEVFAQVHEALGDARPQQNLGLRLTPAFIQPLEQWFASVLTTADTMPSEEEIRQQLIFPLVDQIESDLGETITRLVLGRLGLDGQPQSVREQAKAMDVTRARIYQLYEDCGKMMNVRWPEGQWLFAALSERLHQGGATSDSIRVFTVLRELCYPRNPDASANTIGPRNIVVEPALAD